MTLLERLKEFRKSKDQLNAAAKIHNCIHRELEAAFIAQCVQLDQPISRKRSRREADQALEALRHVFHIITEDIEWARTHCPHCANIQVDIRAQVARKPNGVCAR